MWVNINQNGDLNVSHIPTDYTLVGTVVLVDSDNTILIAWLANEKAVSEAHDVSTFSSSAAKLALQGYACAMWVRDQIDISRKLPGLGMQCSGRYCGEWNNYAEANSDDGRYYCYSCKQRPSSLR